MAISLQYWANYTAGVSKLQRKSENAVASGHVLRFGFDADMNLINSTVQASMRDRSYKVQVMLLYRPTRKFITSYFLLIPDKNFKY